MRVQYVTKGRTTVDQILEIPRQSYVELRGYPRTINGTEEYVLVRHKTLSRNEESNPYHYGKQGVDVPRGAQLKSDAIHQMAKARACGLKAARAYLEGRGYICCPMSRKLDRPTEGGSALYRVDDGSYLAQSPQIEKQVLVSVGVERLYDIGPVFRAEPHNTSRHLNQYVSVDVEQAGTDENAVMRTLRSLIISMSRAMEPYGVRRLSTSDFVKVPYKKALAITGKDTIDRVGEEALSKYFRKPFVFITKYPLRQRTWYTRGSTGFDLVHSRCQIASGSVRESDAGTLERNISAHGLDPKKFSSLLDHYRSGARSSVGFGVGLERLIMVLMNYQNVRQIRTMEYL